MKTWVQILFVVLAYTVKQILPKIGLLVLVSLIEIFRVKSHTPNPAATYIFDDGGRSYQNLGFLIVAIFAFINLLGSCSRYRSYHSSVSWYWNLAYGTLTMQCHKFVMFLGIYVIRYIIDYGTDY